MRLFITILSLLYAIPFNVCAQTNAHMDSLLVQKGLQSSITLYEKGMKESLRIINGSEYKTSYGKIIGHPYFLSDTYKKGSIYYDGVLYQNTSLLYNLFEDEVITEHPIRGIRLRLAKEKIDHFKISGRTFVLLHIDSGEVALPEHGFYELLYNGNLKVYAKLKKVVEETHHSSSITEEFVSKYYYYIKMNNEYHPVKSRASVLRVLKAHKKEIRKQFNKSNLYYSVNRVKSIVFMVELYDKLSSQ